MERQRSGASVIGRNITVSSERADREIERDDRREEERGRPSSGSSHTRFIAFAEFLPHTPEDDDAHLRVVWQKGVDVCASSVQQFCSRCVDRPAFSTSQRALLLTAVHVRGHISRGPSSRRKELEISTNLAPLKLSQCPWSVANHLRFCHRLDTTSWRIVLDCTATFCLPLKTILDLCAMLEGSRDSFAYCLM